jgi:hypothetical protein
MYSTTSLFMAIFRGRLRSRMQRIEAGERDENHAI